MTEEINKAFQEICLDYGIYPDDLAKRAMDFALQVERDTIIAFLCLDCHVSTERAQEYYMVQDDVWLSAVPDGEGMLCIKCLEDRLGRPLNRNDFTDAPVNGGFFPRSDRLIEAQEREPE